MVVEYGNRASARCFHTESSGLLKHIFKGGEDLLAERFQDSSTMAVIVWWLHIVCALHPYSLPLCYVPQCCAHCRFKRSGTGAVPEVGI